MERKYIVSYDGEYDRLMIAGRMEGEKMAGSVRMLNVILDFNSENKVVNAELLHASEYLESLGLDVDLNNVSEGRLSLRQIRNGYEIIFVLKLGKKLIPFSYNIHLPTQKQVKITS